MMLKVNTPISLLLSTIMTMNVRSLYRQLLILIFLERNPNLRLNSKTGQTLKNLTENLTQMLVIFQHLLDLLYHQESLQDKINIKKSIFLMWQATFQVILLQGIIVQVELHNLMT